MQNFIKREDLNNYNDYIKAIINECEHLLRDRMRQMQEQYPALEDTLNIENYGDNWKLNFDNIRSLASLNDGMLERANLKVYED